MEELKAKERRALQILEGMGLGLKSLQPAAKGGAGEASRGARLAPELQEKQRKRPMTQLEPPEDARAARRMKLLPMTKDQIDMLRLFAGKKELSMITGGTYKIGCRMVGDGSLHKLVEEIFLRSMKSAKEAAANYIKEYDAKGYVEEDPTGHELPRCLEPFVK
ncbi:hypothetical protein BAE44_0019336 [Dichanthelium oligosanthes]|uniref:Uncharacterized protein n=1 Tax=Dichanthelium oligosanthes TaxID=888268 RepID=A0A1E5V3M3_9POAL|nr:hypothetical protein BAE44_0019336 [Dichanthelium oligosanthes]